MAYMQKQIVIGIDPGSRYFGYGVAQAVGGKITLLDWGVLGLEKDSLPLRLSQISNFLHGLFSKFPPQIIAVENVFLGKNPHSAFVLGHVRGVVLSHAGLAGAKVYELAARKVKKVVTGQGQADKDQVRKVIESIYKIKVDQYDATDAIAVAICAIHEQGKENILSRFEGVHL